MKNPSKDRFLRAVSDYIVMGENPKTSSQESIHILNFSDYDLIVSTGNSRVLIYPYVVGYFNRPSAEEIITIEGVAENKKYKIHLKRSDFSRKSNVVHGTFDQEQFTSLTPQRLWLKSVINKSDVIKIINGEPKFANKSDDDIVVCRVFHFLSFMLLLCMILIAILIGVWIYSTKLISQIQI